MMAYVKPTKKNTLLYVRNRLATSPAWATKALVRIFSENQTSHEQAAEVTNEDNGIGFTGVDANFLSSLAKQFIAKGSLSEKQMVYVHKKMKKYARQVIAMSDGAKLIKQVEAA
jgi:hypothetical protein